jgi:hypothetical protein
MTGPRNRLVITCIVAVLSVSGVLFSAGPQEERREKMGLSLRVSPALAFSPARVSAYAELRGQPAPGDEAKLYCPAVEWDWGDGTRSEASADCEPYEAGKSEIRRRFSAQHTYTTAGRYRIYLRLKRQDRTVLATNSSIQIRPGARDWGY